MSEQTEIFIDRFNKAWTQGDFDLLQFLLDENVVFVAPDLTTEITGKKACLQTIREYVDHANTQLFEVNDKIIHTWERTAMVSISFYIEYMMNDKLYRENGKEFWTLVQKGDSWKLAWRAMVKSERVE